MAERVCYGIAAVYYATFLQASYGLPDTKVIDFYPMTRAHVAAGESAGAVGVRPQLQVGAGSVRALRKAPYVMTGELPRWAELAKGPRKAD